MNMFHDIIKKICEELNIKMTLLSDGWITVLEKDNQIHYITGYGFDLNNYCVGSIMDDKGLFYDILKYKNIPIVSQKVLFKDYNKDEVLNYFTSHNEEIIVKGSVGRSGQQVFKIRDKKELFRIINELFNQQYSVVLSPYYDIINEYRVVVLKNKVKIIFGKEKPFVIGDGQKNVQTLAQKLNSYYIKNPLSIENPMYIPSQNEKVNVSFKFNLSGGARSFLEIDSILKKQIIELALAVTKQLNITFASVDIIHTKDNQLMVLEANTGVTLNHFVKQNEDEYQTVYQTYKEAMEMMFDIK